MATLLIAAGIVMLRIWNPGRNEPREQREGEEVEGGEQLVEIEEVPEPALASAAAGSSWSRFESARVRPLRVGRLAPGRARRRG